MTDRQISELYFHERKDGELVMPMGIDVEETSAEEQLDYLRMALGGMLTNYADAKEELGARCQHSERRV